MANNEELALQIQALQETLSRSQEDSDAKFAILELKDMFGVADVRQLVPAVKERIASLYSTIEFEKGQFVHHQAANTQLKNERVMLRIRLEAAETRVQVLEQQLEMQRQGLV